MTGANWWQSPFFPCSTYCSSWRDLRLSRLKPTARDTHQFTYRNSFELNRTCAYCRQPFASAFTKPRPIRSSSIDWAFVCGTTAEEQTIHPADLRRILIASFFPEPPGQRSGLFHHELAVEKKQSLQRGAGWNSSRAGDVGIGKIKKTECRIQPPPTDITVHRSPRVTKVVDCVRRSAGSEVQQAGNVQHRISQRLNVQASRVVAPQPTILRVRLGVFGDVLRAEGVGRR